MKSFGTLLALALLAAGMSPVCLRAQPVSLLHVFTNGLDGSIPQSGLVLAGNALYGSTFSGGANDNGTIFSMQADGSGFAVRHPVFGPVDGLEPARMTFADGALFGTTMQGGANSGGTVFSASLDGSSFNTVYAFHPASDGGSPQAGLVLAGSTLYGTTSSGGTNQTGTVFSVNTNGSGFTVLHSFAALGTGPATNADGAAPLGALVLSGSTLYGTTSGGGSNGDGTIFALNTNGTGFVILHHFTGGLDGREPQAGLLFSGGALYGTTEFGGTNDTGTVFSISTNATGFRVLHAFGWLAQQTNSDGALPKAGLLLSGSTLLGTASGGGLYAGGTVYMVDTNGAGFTTLHSFNRLLEGEFPQCDLVLFGNTLYGTVPAGGVSGHGAVFALELQPQISSLTLAGTTLTVNASGGWAGHNYMLLMSTNLALPPSQWTPIATNAVSSNGNFVITGTNPGAGTARQRFYRLETH